MLRPATPLTVLLFVSFVLLLLSVLSTPIIKGVHIATFKGVHFGVFGYCTPKECSGIRIGYTTDGLFGEQNDDSDFSLPSSARHSLSALLIVHPIAAFFNLVCLGLAGAAHLHSPSHSPRYLLALLILLLPTLLVTLLAFLVDILLFIPHLQWAGWIVLASTILITASGVVTCAMRRTLVSRKARKKRIAENAEMSGENFYNRQNSLPKLDLLAPTSGREPMMPRVHGAPGSDRLPAFATFSKEDDTFVGDMDASPKTASQYENGRAEEMGRGDGEPLVPARSRSRDQYMGGRDEYGNAFSPSHPPGAVPLDLHRGPSDPARRQASSRERMNGLPPGPRGGFGYGGARGRGGAYPPRGYGPPRGGSGRPRGGPHVGHGRGGYYDGRGDYNGPGRGGGMAAGPMMGRRQQGPPPGYPPHGPRGPPDQYGGPGGPRQPSPGGGMRRSSSGPTPPLPPNGLVGHAIEMNASSGGVISPADAGLENGQPTQQTVTMPPARLGMSPDHASPGSGHSADAAASRPSNMPPGGDLVSPSSMYSHGPDGYVPPRAAWAGSNRSHSPPRHPGAVSSRTQRRPSAPSSDYYYEDVDPRFSEVSADAPPQHSPLPASLTPGATLTRGQQAGAQQPTRTPSNEREREEGGRSPVGSETSHYTSVSQRGVNPRWMPGSEDMRNMPPPSAMRYGPGGGGGGGAAGGRDRDVLLQNNPDFEIPGMRPPGRSLPRRSLSGNGGVGAPPPGGAGGRMTGPGLMPVPVPVPVSGLTGVSRYPQP